MVCKLEPGTVNFCVERVEDLLIIRSNNKVDFYNVDSKIIEHLVVMPFHSHISLQNQMFVERENKDIVILTGESTESKQMLKEIRIKGFYK